MPLTLRYVARSDVGLVREGNEDSGYAGPFLLAIADGMGGHAAGEVASQAAIEELVQAEHDPSGSDPLEALAGAIRAANVRIRQLIVDDSSREGMGTTVTAFLWTGTALAMGHIGDSRAYLLRDGAIRQLSHDHTFVQSLVDEGRITREEAGVHPARSLILKALQGQDQVEPDLEFVEVMPGDRVLVCSDGLDNAGVSDAAIAEALTSKDDLDAAADELIRLALAGGAPDNVTVVVADVVEVDGPREPDDTAEAYLVGAAAGDQPTTGRDRPQRRRPGAALRGLITGEEKPADPDELEAMRYAPQPPRRFRWVRPVFVVALVALVGWAGLSLANDWVRDQYYVADSSGEVAIYQGVSQEIGPVRLSELYDVPGGLPVRSLPRLVRARVAETIPAEDLDDAQQIVGNLRDQACEAHAPDPSPTGTATTPPATPPATPPGGTGTGTTGGTSGTGGTTPDPRATTTPTPDPTPDFPGLECSEWS
ncbi:MAG TPA: protein phosphatase 2C domain-containing protein [Jiangellaceae bacterium]